MVKDNMKPRKNTFYVLAVLCAVTCFAFFSQGCKRKAQPEKPPRHAPESYMNDAEFCGKLDEARKEQIRLVQNRNTIAEKMKAKIDAMREKLKTSDTAKIKAELEKDPEWNDLYTKCTNANARCVENRRKTLGTVKERIAPKRPVSK